MFSMKFGEKLKLIQEKIDLSKIAFAKEFGVAFETINRWEKEYYMPKYVYVNKLEEYSRDKIIK